MTYANTIAQCNLRRDISNVLTIGLASNRTGDYTSVFTKIRPGWERKLGIFLLLLLLLLLLLYIGLVSRVFTNGPGDMGSIPGRVLPKTLKMVLDTSLTLNNIRYVLRVKWSNPRKGVAPSPTSRCSSY